MAHPILGDATHGKGPLNRWWAQRLGGQRLWLHAHALQLQHPRTGEALALTADWHALAQVPEVQRWRRMLQLPGWRTVGAFAGQLFRYLIAPCACIWAFQGFIALKCFAISGTRFYFR